MKKLLALAPILPQASDLEALSDSLDFLRTDYNVTWLDPLSNFNGLSYELYSSEWVQKIQDFIDDFDVYIGFSLGAVLIQQAFECFVDQNKKIIFFSPPSVITTRLHHKLERVLTVLRTNSVKEALDLLYKDVFSYQVDYKKKGSESWSVIAERLEYGLGYVMQSQVDKKMRASKIVFHQYVGLDSKLVTYENLCLTESSVTHRVPNAGMRVLEDNPGFCQKTVKEYLNESK